MRQLVFQDMRCPHGRYVSPLMALTRALSHCKGLHAHLSTNALTYSYLIVIGLIMHYVGGLNIRMYRAC